MIQRCFLCFAVLHLQSTLPIACCAFSSHTHTHTTRNESMHATEEDGPALTARHSLNIINLFLHYTLCLALSLVMSWEVTRSLKATTTTTLSRQREDNIYVCPPKKMSSSRKKQASKKKKEPPPPLAKPSAKRPKTNTPRTYRNQPLPTRKRLKPGRNPPTTIIPIEQQIDEVEARGGTLTT